MTLMDAEMNQWFDPIDPLPSISRQDVCNLHSELVNLLSQQSSTSFAEHVSFSYIATLNLFLQANQQSDYENCIYSEVSADPA